MSYRAYLLGPVLALALIPSNVVAAALPLLRADWDATATTSGWVFAAYQVGRARAAFACAMLSGVCSFVFGFLATAPWPVLLGIGCVYGLLISADSAIYSTAVTELALAGRIGSAQAVQAFAGFGATAAAPVAAGLVLDLGLGWGGAFALAGAAGIALALPLLPLTKQSTFAGYSPATAEADGA